MTSLTGATLITGVGKGFGRDLFIHRVKKFGNVVGLTRTQEDIDSLNKELAEESNKFHLFNIDVTNFDEVIDCVLDDQGEKLQEFILVPGFIESFQSFIKSSQKHSKLILTIILFLTSIYIS